MSLKRQPSVYVTKTALFTVDEGKLFVQFAVSQPKSLKHILDVDMDVDLDVDMESMKNGNHLVIGASTQRLRGLF